MIAVFLTLWRYRTLTLAAALIIALCAALFTVGLYREEKSKRKAAEAYAVAAVKAIEDLRKLDGRSVATDAQVKEAIDEVRKAEPSDRDRIARDHLCKLQSRC